MKELKISQSDITVTASAEKAANDLFKSLFGEIEPSRYESSHMTEVLDGSGSMMGLENKLKAAVSELERQFPEMSIKRIMFDHALYDISSISEYRAFGETALRDAIIASIEQTEMEINHNNVIIPILTDGWDNRSQTSVEDCRRRVEEKKSLGWQFFAIFIGPQYQLSQVTPVFKSLGMESVVEQDIIEAIKKLSEGINGYLETGILQIGHKK